VSRTQVGIVGAGPSGLLLAHLLHRQGIESVVLEDRTREYVIARVRAGVLEQGVVDVFRAAGLADRIEAEGLVHHGIELRFGGSGHRIPLSDLAGGRVITVYGQQEVVKDLIAARLDAGGEIRFSAGATEPVDLESSRPGVAFGDGREDTLHGPDEIARISHAGITLFLLLQNGHRDFREVVEHQVIDLTTFHLTTRRFQPVAPEALTAGYAHDAR